MEGRRDVGRVRVRRRARGRARVGPAGVAEVDPQKTTRLRTGEVPAAPPVFVDETGRRHRGLRRLAFAACVVALLLLVALWASQLTRSSGPGTRTPLCPSAGAAAGPTGVGCATP
jgi:hypothetical protein